MAVRDRADIASSLKRKGFVLDTKKGRDHDYYIFEHPGLTTQVYTKLSRGSGYKTYDKTLLGDMKDQLKLTTMQLLQLIDCTMDGTEYLKALISQGVVDEKKLDAKKAPKRK